MVVHRDTRTPDEHLGPLQRLSPEQIAALEAENGLLQFDEVQRLILESVESGDCLLTPPAILNLQRIAVQGLEATAGSFRDHPVSIGGTSHVPPEWRLVPSLVEEMCAYVMASWSGEASYLHLSAYVMWRMNWIHPFSNGNGRTSRAVSYYVMCARIGALLPGKTTVPDRIAANKGPYYAALDSADAACRAGRLDVSAMETLLGAHLIQQLKG